MLQERRRDEKDDIGYAILDYYSAQYSLGDWFDVNMKVYSITFFLKQQRVSSTKNKNNTGYFATKYVEIPFFIMTWFLLQLEQSIYLIITPDIICLDCSLIILYGNFGVSGHAGRSAESDGQLPALCGRL